MVRRVTSSSFSKLSHAYGEGSDVPGLVKALRSSNAKQRARALFGLGASLCHQGTFYSATAPTVPLLLEVLSDPKAPGKDGVLELLADFATVDVPEEYALSGFRTREALKLIPKSWGRVLDAVNAGAPVVRSLLTAKEPQVRAAAAYLLAWLDRSAAASVEPLRVALKEERVARVRASLVFALAHVAHAAKVDVARELAVHLDDTDLLVRTGAALASGVGGRSASPRALEVLGVAATTKALVKSGTPWLGGNLAFLAARALVASREHRATTGPLLTALERNVTGAELVARALVPRLLTKQASKGAKNKAPKRKKGEIFRRDLDDAAALAGARLQPAHLNSDQRRLLTAMTRHLESVDQELGLALEQRGLPSTLAQLQRWLSGEPEAQSVLDRRVGAKTVGALFIEAVKAKGEARAKKVAELVKRLPGDDAIDAAWEAEVNLDGEDVLEVVLDVAWAAGPKGEKALRAAVTRLERDGPPKWEDPAHDSIIHFIGCFVLVGVGLAALALAKKRPAEPLVDRYLQRQYGFVPRVRDALAALPLTRREAWVLSSARDNRAQPAQYFFGAWPYFLAVPTPKVTQRVLKHVSTWKPKDPWGGRREKYADPHLVAYLEAARVAKQDVRALEQALAKVRG